MSRWTGAMVVTEAHVYEVEADSQEQARERIESLFENGEPAVHVHVVACYPEGISQREEKE